MKVAFVLGTRPEIIKLEPVIRECKKRHVLHFIIHTNQHYSENMDRVFFKQLKIIDPKYNLKIKAKAHGEMVGKMLIKIEKILQKEHPYIVVVQGDTNSALAGGLAAQKLGIKLAHVEAGLRSFDKSMPEEINRTIIDHCADYLFAPTNVSRENLINENIGRDKIFIVGNTIVESLRSNNKNMGSNKKLFKKYRIVEEQYILFTCHRQENTNYEPKLKNIIEALEKLSTIYNTSIIFPAHPRTIKIIEAYKINISPAIKIVEPLGYFDFLMLERHAKLVITDSGGVQEECCLLKIPCLTIRENTERPETVEAGGNILVGTDVRKILCGAEDILKRKRSWSNPFGKGNTSKLIVDELIESS